MMSVAVRAPAKVNLGLRVLRKRPDGYHDIETIMQMVSLYDDLVVEEADQGIEVVTDCDELPPGRGNLVYRAADLLSQDAGISPAIRIRLTKKIPLAAGLGGGSSDAAATLVALNRLWGLDFSKQRLMALAVKLGMDLPFFLFSPTALATGRGEHLERLTPPSPPHWIVLVNPGFHVSTKWAYEGLKLGLTIENKHISMRRFSVSPGGDTRFENNLERITLKQFPVLQEIKEALKKRGAEEALMSGSGPTIFGLFADRDQAWAAYEALAERKGFAVFLTRTLSAFPPLSEPNAASNPPFSPERR